MLLAAGSSYVRDVNGCTAKQKEKIITMRLASLSMIRETVCMDIREVYGYTGRMKTKIYPLFERLASLGIMGETV